MLTAPRFWNVAILRYTHSLTKMSFSIGPKLDLFFEGVSRTGFLDHIICYELS